ncbi:MAG: type II secretion system major pseudopilin GspG [Hyphomicrobiales bacterium]
MSGNDGRKRAGWRAPRRSDEAGFTLVELLVVLVILVLLASIIGPRVIGYLGASRTKTAKVQIESLVTSLELFHIDVGRYPATSEGLTALVKPPTKLAGWSGPYITKSNIPADPWGRPYRYQAPGKKGAFDLYTLGRDGKEGGTDEDSDVSN